MNDVKFVPGEPSVRALSKPEVLVFRCTQNKQCMKLPLFKLAKLRRPPTVREAEIMAGRRGWVRLAYLPKSERARYRKAKEIRA